jgi:hypothetical protein
MTTEYKSACAAKTAGLKTGHYDGKEIKERWPPEGGRYTRRRDIGDLRLLDG